ncbi:polysaccharide deacetylase family protein [Pontimicrobium aquaticum]|uniref:Polysaccharide deacetylase n=1 Tax=Pontimicrobium aquaticum TaxID=2565367 RepID=A0A4U0EP83_9FLAO|nr:polysaccharide deacetylase family protein [Pontimicrobium aquaticum]TJY33437.1 polysaccharide deacetylase [Pontimicrobium aquaticum]
MSDKNGHFVISLDYELHWGVFDKCSVASYEKNLKNTREVIEKLLALSDKYNIKLTFATVGFLFAKDKNDLVTHAPKDKPSYKNNKLNPYLLLDSIGNNEMDDPYHFGNSILKKIKESGNHEISTHTYCHYYCNEKGQTIQQFQEDITAAKNIAKNIDIEIESIIFPRNMINKEYLELCYKNGITSYRGTEKAYIYNIDPKSIFYKWQLFRILRVVDGYLNITGHNTYNVKNINKKDHTINIPSSRFLRPFSPKLKAFEWLKLRRIRKSMKHAAKNNELFHLWWHPHNFGNDIDKNIENLEKVFVDYKKLNSKYNFSSVTMTSLAKKITSSLVISNFISLTREFELLSVYFAS